MNCLRIQAVQRWLLRTLSGNFPNSQKYWVKLAREKSRPGRRRRNSRLRRGWVTTWPTVVSTSARSHTRTSHRLTIKEYVKQFGNYREQLHTVTWHSCGLCQKEILLDGDEIHKHCRAHGVTMAEYSNLFIVSNGKKFASASKQFESPLSSQVPFPKKKVTGLLNTIEAIENILDSLWQ